MMICLLQRAGGLSVEALTAFAASYALVGNLGLAAGVALSAPLLKALVLKRPQPRFATGCV